MFPYCKIALIETNNQRYSKPKRPDNLTLDIKKKVGAAKKCLFGVPEKTDTKVMLQEQERMDRERFHERFGFSIEDLENFDKENTVCRKILKPAKKSKGKVLSNVNHHQSVLTDYFKARKNVQTGLKKEDD